MTEIHIFHHFRFIWWYETLVYFENTIILWLIYMMHECLRERRNIYFTVMSAFYAQYLEPCRNEIFPYSFSSGWKFDPKTVNFDCLFEWFFRHFLGCYLKQVDETWSEVGPNGYQSDAYDCRVIQSSIQEILGSKIAKVNQNGPNLVNDPNFFSKNDFFCQSF